MGDSYTALGLVGIDLLWVPPAIRVRSMGHRNFGADAPQELANGVPHHMH